MKARDLYQKEPTAEIVEYVRATEAVLKSKGLPPSELEEMVEELAYVFLTPWPLFKVWVWAVVCKFF